MRAHLRWIVPLICVPVSYVLIMLLLQLVRQTVPDAESSVGWSFAQLGILVAALIVPVVLLIVAIVQAARVRRRARRSKGRFTRFEQAMLDRGRQTSDAWERARATRSLLLAQQAPAPIEQWDVIPYPDEVFLARTQLTYARYYGQDAAYSQSSGFAFGSPGFVVGALAVTAIANAGVRARAAAMSAPQWREWQLSDVYLTDRRIVVFTGGQWLSFDYSTMTAVYPEVASATLVCQFQNAEPMLLSGDDAALACVFTVLYTHGLRGVDEHPALRALDRPVQLPELPPVGGRG